MVNMARKRRVVPKLNRFQPLTPNSMVLRSGVTREGVQARFAAKKEGQAAAVRIAKARAAKKKKAPLTALATRTNREANIIRKKNAGVKISQSNSGGWVYFDGTKNPPVIRAKEVKRKYKPEDYTAIPENDKKVKSLMAESKTFARRSGGHATAMKRNAEAGIAHIVRGRAMKSVARASGVLGIASLFAQHLAGGKKEKKNG